MMFILMLFIKLASIFEALFIAINRSKYKNNAANKSAKSTIIITCPPIPPLVSKLQTESVFSVGCASVAT